MTQSDIIDLFARRSDAIPFPLISWRTGAGEGRAARFTSRESIVPPFHSAFFPFYLPFCHAYNATRIDSRAACAICENKVYKIIRDRIDRPSITEASKLAGLIGIVRETLRGGTPREVPRSLVPSFAHPSAWTPTIDKPLAR